MLCCFRDSISVAPTYKLKAEGADQRNQMATSQWKPMCAYAPLALIAKQSMTIKATTGRLGIG